MGNRKNVLVKYTWFLEEPMTSDLASSALSIQFLDNMSVQLSIDSDAIGSIEVQGSVDKEGWVTLPDTVALLSGTPLSSLIYLNQLSFPYLRLAFTNEFVESGTITTVADDSGSLNSTYFLIDGADGDDWYVWLDDGGGVDPMVPDRTGIQVTYTDDDTADDIATAVEAALSACTSFDSTSVMDNVISYTQSAGGNGPLTDGAEPTGFTFDVTQSSALFTAKVSGKMIS